MRYQMIKIIPNYGDIDFCYCCGMTLDSSKIKGLEIINDRNDRMKSSVYLCTQCRKLLLNKLKEDLNEI